MLAYKLAYVGLCWPMLAHLGPMLASRSPKMASRCAKLPQVGLKLAQVRPNLGQLRPTWPSNRRFLRDFEGHVGSKNRQNFNIYRKIWKKVIFWKNTVKHSVFSLKLRFRGIKNPWKIDPKWVEKSIQIWTSLGNASKCLKNPTLKAKLA